MKDSATHGSRKPPTEAPVPRERWTRPGAGRAYAEARFATARRAERDPRLALALLAPFLRGVRPRLLDAPCGAGRLQPALAEAADYVGLDVSPEMLGAARARSAALLRASVEALPFADGTFDALVSCRLLHHFREDHDLVRILREFRRVTHGPVIASFWDAGSLPALRRRLFSGRPSARVARSRAHMRALLAEAGLVPVAWRASCRFVSRQTFFAATARP